MAEKKEEIVAIQAIPVNERLKSELFDDSYYDFSLFSKNDVLVNPLDPKFKQGKYCFEKLINRAPTDQNFLENVEYYLASKHWRIPYNSPKFLNVSLDSASNPVNPDDYLCYLTAQEYVKAESISVVEAGSLKEAKEKAPWAKVFFYSLKDKTEKTLESQEDTMKAYSVLNTIYDNKEWEKLSWILSYYGFNYSIDDVSGMKEKVNDVINGLAGYAPDDVKSGKQNIEYKKRPAKHFSLICNDDKIETKALIDFLTRNGELQLVGSKYYLNDRVIGDGLDNTVNNVLESTPDANKLMSELKARLEILKKNRGI